MDRKQMAILVLALAMVFALVASVRDRPTASASLQADVSDSGGEVQFSLELGASGGGLRMAAHGLPSIPSLY